MSGLRLLCHCAVIEMLQLFTSVGRKRGGGGGGGVGGGILLFFCYIIIHCKIISLSFILVS